MRQKNPAAIATQRVCITLPSDLISLMDSARAGLVASQSSFIAQALSAYVRRWKSPIDGKAPVAVWASGWPKNAKCYHCKKLGHDPEVEHGYAPGEFEFGQLSKLTVA